MTNLKTSCERCAKELPEDCLDACTCAFGCTFCADCTAEPLARLCPNCGGELLARPAKKLAPAPMPYDRIVCLSQETAETLALLGLESRVVGVSKFVARPQDGFPGAARIGGFSTTDVQAIVELEPDLVLAYSDVQAGIAKELIKAGLTVHVFNHTSLAGMLLMVRRLGHLVGVPRRAELLAQDLEAQLAAAEAAALNGPRPKVYFEEWDEPAVCGIRWVSELIELAGGRDVFADIAERPHARERMLEASEIMARAPEVILASWCGKPLNQERLAARPGFASLPAVQGGCVFELEGAAILSPGPSLVTEGLGLITRILQQATGS